jgi:hypothetical protein
MIKKDLFVKVLKFIFLIFASCFVLQGCGTFNTDDQELDSPTVGTAQTGDPATFEHRN